MTNSLKISGIQVFWMMASMEIGMTLLLTLSPAISDTKQDAWISMLIAGGASVMITFIATKVSLHYPDQTLIELSQTILGKWIGKVIVIPYFVMWYSVTGIILRESSDFIHIALFRKTPLWILVVTFLMLIIYVTYQGGLESIGRCSEILGPIIFLSIMIVLVLNFYNMLLPSMRYE